MNKILVDRLNECKLTPSDILSQIIKSHDDQAVFVYTSQLENLGTKDSDFDVYVMSETLPNDENIQSYPNYKVQIAFLNGKVLDIEYWDLKNVYRLVDAINNFNYKELSIEEIKLIHRLKIAGVINESEIGDTIKTLIQNSKLKDIVVKKYIVNANSELQDTIALFNSGEYISALISARNALEYSIGALNAKNGHTNLKYKWISKIFMNNNGYSEDLLNKYLKYQVYCNINSDNIESFVEDMLEFTQNIISTIAI